LNETLLKYLYYLLIGWNALLTTFIIHLVDSWMLTLERPLGSWGCTIWPVFSHVLAFKLFNCGLICELWYIVVYILSWPLISFVLKNIWSMFFLIKYYQIHNILYSCNGFLGPSRVKLFTRLFRFIIYRVTMNKISFVHLDLHTFIQYLRMSIFYHKVCGKNCMFVCDIMFAS